MGMLTRRAEKPKAEKVDPPSHVVEEEVRRVGPRFVFRNKPEVEELIARVVKLKPNQGLAMTGAEWDMWTKYVQVLP
jgi:hypothetical protein